MSSTTTRAVSTQPDIVSERISFPSVESGILQYWDDINAFETSLQQSKAQNRPLYTFYDGPPFATGLPHYGHILAGTIKDVVTRYAQQCGYHVERRFGWDCHGLPVEHEIDTKFSIKSRDDVLKLVSSDKKLHGIAAYNNECRSIVQRYVSEWEATVKRVGRWIDFKSSYKTMDLPYMESVWWVFSQLYSKGLVYRGFKVMPYSTACTTPLSNFEANLNYKDVSDPAVFVTFPLLLDTNTSLIAWTTTPWTLPSNMALTVNPNMMYVKVRDNKTNKQYIVMKARINEIYPVKKVKHTKTDKKSSNNPTTDSALPAPQISNMKLDDKLPSTDEYTVIDEFLGIQLKNQKYQPLFNYLYDSNPQAFRIITGEFVTADSGTGVVHCAPMFGEDDMQVCLAEGIIMKGSDIPMPVDDSGRFTSLVIDFSGKHVKDADKHIIQYLKQHDRLHSSGSIVHSYPFCWRSDTPLIYRAVPSWFVSVETIKQQLIDCNSQTHWVPENIQTGRFANWLKDARDWAISRNRYWGTPIPIWSNADQSEIVVCGSVAELSELSGIPIEQITDLHSDKISHITIPSKTNPGTVLHIIDAVFDCWFESGSMPYAQQHYPFNGATATDTFEREQFPADFVSEGLDQTRGWFYTLMVLSTALFNKPAFKHLICSGLVLAGDGKKMCWGTGTKLLMYDGSSKCVEDITEDDVLMGDDSTPRHVLHNSLVKGEAEMYQVRLQNAGRDVWTCNAQHVLVCTVEQQPSIESVHGRYVLYTWVIVPGSDSGSYVPRRKNISTFTLRSDCIAAMLEYRLKWSIPVFTVTVRDYLSLSTKKQLAMKMYQPDMVHFPPPELTLTDCIMSVYGMVVSSELTQLVAWSLGMWLADGWTNDAEIAQIQDDINNPLRSHKPVIDKLKSLYVQLEGVDSADHIVKHHHISSAGNNVYNVVMGCKYKQLLQHYNLINNKHIPLNLLRESVDNRMALLAGIIDGDGDIQVSERCFRVSTKHRVFMDGLVHLSRGLGFSTGSVCQTKVMNESGDICPGHIITIGGSIERVTSCLTLQYKSYPAKLSDDTLRLHNPLADTFTVKPIGRSQYHGFELDGNSKCLLGDFIITHNSKVCIYILHNLLR